MVDKSPTVANEIVRQVSKEAVALLALRAEQPLRLTTLAFCASTRAAHEQHRATKEILIRIPQEELTYLVQVRYVNINTHLRICAKYGETEWTKTLRWVTVKGLPTNELVQKKISQIVTTLATTKAVGSFTYRAVVTTDIFLSFATHYVHRELIFGVKLEPSWLFGGEVDEQSNEAKPDATELLRISSHITTRVSDWLHETYTSGAEVAATLHEEKIRLDKQEDVDPQAKA